MWTKKDERFLVGTTGGMNIGVYTLFKGEIIGLTVAYVRCYCPSTDRIFHLYVHPDNTNAKDAIASLYKIPSILKPHITGILRQGERFTTELTDKGKELAKTINKDTEYTSVNGNTYFSLLKYEY